MMQKQEIYTAAKGPRHKQCHSHLKTTVVAAVGRFIVHLE